jgi:hypothetical protein
MNKKFLAKSIMAKITMNEIIVAKLKWVKSFWQK